MNTIAAVGAFAEDENAVVAEAPATVEEAIAKLDEIAAKYNMGEVLSDEDQAIVRGYLPVVGADKTSISDDGAFVGQGQFEFEQNTDNLQLHVEGSAGCAGMGEGRIEYWNELSVRKTGGDTTISDFAFTFKGVSFGMGPSGKMKVIYKREFDRSFAGSESAVASFRDRYTLTQWGFYYTCSCKLTTSTGDVLVK